MRMTDGEIRSMYKSAKYKKKQIEILAQLNCCDTGKILQIIHNNRDVKEKLEKHDSTDCIASRKADALMDRLDELNSMIKPLEDEYRGVIKALMQITDQSREI
mgnify:CR=1 FL=1